jgi:hypothetical protein
VNKVTGLLLFLLSTILAIGTLLNLRFVLILLLNAKNLDLHAWWVTLGRLSAVFILGFLAVKAFSAGKKRIFGDKDKNISSLSAMTMTVNASTQQVVIESEFVIRSSLLLASYWVVFVGAAIFSIVASVSIAAFQELFQSFDAEIPALTNIVISYQIFLFALPLITLIPDVHVTRKKTIEKNAYKNYKVGVAILLSLLCVIFFTVVAALYLPIFYLNQGS